MSASLTGLALAALLVLLGATVAALMLRRAPGREARGTFFEHVAELRERILRVAGVGLAALVLALGVRIELHPWRDLIVTVPVPDLYDNMAAQLFRAVAAHVVPPGVQLVATSPTDGFSAQFTMALGIAIAVALPVAIVQLGRFFGPAVGSRGRRLLTQAVVPATALFVLGALFCYVLVIPLTMRALYDFNAPLGASNLLQVTDLAGLVMSFMIGFGIAFETPVLMVAMSRAGLVSSAVYFRGWRHAILAILVAAAILTPDPTLVGQLMLAGPVLLLYFGGALLARQSERIRGARTI